MKEQMFIAARSCPASIQKGTFKDVTLVATQGTPPFTFKLYADNSTIAQYVGSAGEMQHVFTGVGFTQDIGTHRYKGEITDGCSNIISDTCDINIVDYIPPPPSPTGTSATTSPVPYIIAGVLGVALIGMMIKNKKK